MTVTILNGDCRTELALLPDSSVDLVLTDPPYGMSYRSNRRTVQEKFRGIEGDADADLFAGVVGELYRVLRDDRHAYVFCSWHRVDEFKRAFENYFTLKNILVWNKNNHGSGDLKGAFAPKHEFILFGHKGRRELSRRLPDVLDFPKIASAALTHPTEKPQALLRTLIGVSSAPGETVLDCFAGTGSTGLACVAEGRAGVLVEKDPGYAALASRRVACAEMLA